MDANTKDKSNRRLTQIDADRSFKRRRRDFRGNCLRPSAFICGLCLSSGSFASIRGSFLFFLCVLCVSLVKFG
jgi:hypothetical protein